MDLNNFLEQRVYKDQNVESFIETIVSDVDETKKDIQKTLKELMEVISTTSDEEIDMSSLIGFIGPIAKDLYDLQIKNTKNKIDVARVIQRFYETDKKISLSDSGIDDDLFKSFEKELKLIKNDTKETEEEFGKIKSNITTRAESQG